MRRYKITVTNGIADPPVKVGSGVTGALGTFVITGQWGTGDHGIVVDSIAGFNKPRAVTVRASSSSPLRGFPDSHGGGYGPIGVPPKAFKFQVSVVFHIVPSSLIYSAAGTPGPCSLPIFMCSRVLQFRISKGGVNIVNIPVISLKATKTASASRSPKPSVTNKPATPSSKASASVSKSPVPILQVCSCQCGFSIFI